MCTYRIAVRIEALFLLAEARDAPSRTGAQQNLLYSELWNELWLRVERHAVVFRAAGNKSG